MSCNHKYVPTMGLSGPLIFCDKCFTMAKIKEVPAEVIQDWHEKPQHYSKASYAVNWRLGSEDFRMARNLITQAWEAVHGAPLPTLPRETRMPE